MKGARIVVWQRLHHHLDAAAGEVMRGKVVNRQRDAAFHGGNPHVHNNSHRHAAQAQGDEFGELHPRAGEQRADPHAEEIDDDDNFEEEDEEDY